MSENSFSLTSVVTERVVLSEVDTTKDGQEPYLYVDPLTVKHGMEKNDCRMATILQPAEMLEEEILLHRYTQENNIYEVRKLVVTKRVRVDAPDHFDRTALMFAAGNGHVDLIQVLIKEGANVGAEDKYGMTALLWAAKYSQRDSFHKLCSTHCADILHTNKQGLNVLHLAALNNDDNLINYIFVFLEEATISKREIIGGQHSVSFTKLLTFAFGTKESRMRRRASYVKVNKGTMTDKHKKFESLFEQREVGHGRTAVHVAVKQGHIELVEKLMEYRTDIMDDKDKNGHDPLALAAWLGSVKMVDMLLEFPHKIHGIDVRGRTALHLAVESGVPEVVDLLLGKSAADPFAISFTGNTPLHFAASLGYTDIMASLIESMDDVNEKNNKGNTALHLAASANHTITVTTLIHSNHSCDIDARNLREETALHCAVDKGNIAVVELLLVAGASLTATEKRGKRALDLAVRNGLVTVVDLVIKAERFQDLQKERRIQPHVQFQIKERVEVDLKRFNYALRKITVECFKVCEWKVLADEWFFRDDHMMAIENDFVGRKGWREHGYRMCVIWLHGLNKESNAMMMLCKTLMTMGRTQLALDVKSFLQNTQHEGRRDSAISCVGAENGHIEESASLDQGISDHDITMTGVIPAGCLKDNMDNALGLDSMDNQDSDGRSASYLAVESGMVENVDKLLKTNANLVTQTFQGNTLLHLAASLGHTDIMAALMKKMADVNVRNEDGETALHLATSANHTMAVATIIHSNHGCDIDARNLREETPLHCAVDKGNIAVVELLLVAGANLRTIQKSGKSALELACRNGFVTIIDEIIKCDRFRELQRMGNIEPCVEFSIGYRVDVDWNLFTQILSDLTHKYLAQQEWKQLAEHWGFYEHHLSAIEQEFEGPNSWKKHGYRMCLIWLHGLNEEDDPMKCLNEVLVKRGKEKIAKKLENQISRQKAESASTGRCVLS